MPNTHLQSYQNRFVPSSRSACCWRVFACSSIVYANISQSFRNRRRDLRSLAWSSPAFFHARCDSHRGRIPHAFRDESRAHPDDRSGSAPGDAHAWKQYACDDDAWLSSERGPELFWKSSQHSSVAQIRQQSKLIRSAITKQFEIAFPFQRFTSLTLTTNISKFFFSNFIFVFFFVLLLPFTTHTKLFTKVSLRTNAASNDDAGPKFENNLICYFFDSPTFMRKICSALEVTYTWSCRIMT